MPRRATTSPLGLLVDWLLGPRRRQTLRRRVPRRRTAEEVSRRAELARRVDSLARHWEPILGVAASSWRIRRMRTRWGSCNVRARRIWLNLALVDRPLECLEYVVVHELVHLHEPRHDARFHSWMDRHLPDWRERKALLNQPLLDQRRSRIFTNSASAAGSSD